MAKWRFYEGEDDPLSGCELEMDGFRISVNPNRPPHGFTYFISWYGYMLQSPTRSPTRDEAQQAALDKLIALTSGWHTMATKARAELEPQQVDNDQH
jgi:hypothetical protein